MKRSKLLEIIKEVLDEQEGGAVGNVTGAIPAYSTPNAFAKPGQGRNRATKATEKLGFKPVKMKKRPYNTKGFTYLDENK